MSCWDDAAADIRPKMGIVTRSNNKGIEANRCYNNGDDEGGEDNRERTAMITNGPRPGVPRLVRYLPTRAMSIEPW